MFFLFTSINVGFVLVYFGVLVVCEIGDVFFELTKTLIVFYFQKSNFSMMGLRCGTWVFHVISFGFVLVYLVFLFFVDLGMCFLTFTKTQSCSLFSFILTLLYELWKNSGLVFNLYSISICTCYSFFWICACLSWCFCLLKWDVYFFQKFVLFIFFQKFFL